MKSSAPWSVKGVERDARETAKEAARREGMTVGEWLNQVIYTASDPASSNGQIEGLKISDLVSAIEHVSRRVINAEGHAAEGFEDLARGLSGVVERVQRLERHRPDPAGAGAPAEVEARLAALESRAGDRERIEALKALERALGQVAAQFDAAQKTSADRLQAIERRFDQFANRIETDSAGVGGAIDHLKNTVDGVSARLARLERSAQEPQKPRVEGPAADPEFVERTGARLRVLGEEIKRGGDQIRGLEASIRKLAVQIDAAEKRSSEGVQKVAETISELRSQIGEADAQRPAEARADIEAAIAETARRTEQRINDLQRSFEVLLTRLEQAGRSAPPIASAPATSPASAAPAAAPAAYAHPAAEAPTVDARREPAAPARPAAAVATPASVVSGSRETASDELKDALSAFDLDFESVSEDFAQPTEPEANPDLDFEIGAEPTAPAAAATQPDDAARNILSEVEAAFAGESAGRAPAAMTPIGSAEGPADDIDSILAELEGFDSAQDAEPSAAPTGPLTAQKPASPNYIQEARRAAKEAAERAAQSEATSRRKLTPKQRAILAAKIRRKRLAAEQAAETPGPAPAAAPSPRDDVALAAPEAENPTQKPRGGSLFAGAAAAIGRLAAARKTTEPAADADEAAASDARAPDARAAAPRTPKVKPLTLALGAAVVLAGVAVVLPVKDMLVGQKPKPAPRAPEPRAARDAQTPAPAIAPEAAAPQIPEPPVVKPRALFLDSVARLKAAETDADRRAALKGIEDAAALGHPPAQLQLGEIYRVGQGVPVDFARARAWFERAANGGNILAMHRLGVMSARGQGGPVDQLAAISWFEKAATLGLVDSKYNLGALYHPGSESGSGVQDAAKAYFWYTLAARQGDDQAASLAAGLAGGLTPAQRREMDSKIAAWTQQTPDPDANENAQAS